VRWWNRDRVSVALISLGTTLIVAAVVLLVLVATDVIDDGRRGNSDLETITTFGEPIKTPTAGPSPTPSNQFPPGSEAPIARLVVPRVDIDAPVVIKGVDAAGVMQSPDNAYDTAWYDFSARPGFGGNAVFSGHVDYINVGKAVFWPLKDLVENDIIEVRLEDGTVYRYAVKSKIQYAAATAPVDEIVGPTANETITLITCSGTFNSSTRQYDQRLVVRAERVADDWTPPGPTT
jgi:LPXTG-site transpeptidase (sortase) family protein